MSSHAYTAQLPSTLGLRSAKAARAHSGSLTPTGGDYPHANLNGLAGGKYYGAERSVTLASTRTGSTPGRLPSTHHPRLSVVASTILLIGVLTINGCASSKEAATRDYTLASATYAKTVEGLTTARRTGLITSDATWGALKVAAAEANAVLDEWNDRIDTGDFTFRPSDLSRLMRKLAQAYFEIYGEQP